MADDDRGDGVNLGTPGRRVGGQDPVTDLHLLNALAGAISQEDLGGTVKTVRGIAGGGLAAGEIAVVVARSADRGAGVAGDLAGEGVAGLAAQVGWAARVPGSSAGLLAGLLPAAGGAGGEASNVRGQAGVTDAAQRRAQVRTSTACWRSRSKLLPPVVSGTVPEEIG
ncbi:hypothetical protein [Frankia sp. ArI3]|uniref:hypothetical protein n=1 Tax=Frankia sp. ArI3 TaxID=1858 RepID=UPI001C6FCB06|nr:hypothetical protein [Frankia sp. ArI3]